MSVVLVSWGVIALAVAASAVCDVRILPCGRCGERRNKYVAHRCSR